MVTSALFLNESGCLQQERVVSFGESEAGSRDWRLAGEGAVMEAGDVEGCRGGEGLREIMRQQRAVTSEGATLGALRERQCGRISAVG